MKQLLLATHNHHKACEIRSLLRDLDLEILTLDRFSQVGGIVEDADSLEGNAVKKAHAVFRLTGLPCLADDTGLEVYYLNNEPGVYSSRYAGQGATYADNCKKLLERLRGVPPRRRAARFRCVFAFVAQGSVEALAEGICPGVITEIPRGDGGFGYDPLFRPTGFKETFAEMDPTVKNTVSHRAKAAQNMRMALRNYFQKYGDRPLTLIS